VKTNEQKMNVENNYAVSADFLIQNLAEEMFRGAKLIGKIDDSVYCKSTNGVGSIGGHFRHNLDFFKAFLNGLTIGKIDYNRRKRDLQIEENRLYAINQFAKTICIFRNLPLEIFDKKVLIRSEINSDFWLESSAMRELEFLHSHTIHHHALIADRLKSFGIRTAKDFGVAPSTLKFWAEEKRAA
jgi:hypothetical protein